MKGIRVGLATVDFTPRVGLPLVGNFRDDYLSRGVHDPLLAKALVVATAAGSKAAVLAMDLCLVDRENVAAVREAVASRCDVPPANVLVHATHTHSGPLANDFLAFGVDIEPYRDDIKQFLEKGAAAVVAANEDLAPAELSVGYATEERISFNRRLRRTDGSTQMNWEALMPGFHPEAVDAPWGRTDPQVACLVVERQGAPRAAVVNFGLHPAILAGDNWLYSADYPGYLAEALSRLCGPDFMTIFLNGPCGDVNHVDYRDLQQGRGFQMTQRVGYILATAVAAAMHARTPVATDVVAASRAQIALARLKISPAEQRRCAQVLERAKSRPAEGLVDGLPDVFFADSRLKMARLQDRPDEVEVAVLRLGDVGLVGLPGEIFCESGMAIKHRSAAAHTLVAELTNDSIGYLPTRDSFAQGGYEVTVGSTFYEPGAAERLVDSAVSQLAHLFDKNG